MKRGVAIRSGLDDFKKFLAEFRALSRLAVGAGLSVPFAAAFVDIAPPWPRGIILITAVIQLIVLISVYQFFASATRKRTNRMIVFALVFLAISALGYLYLFNRYTFVIPTTATREVKGFVPTDEAKLVYATGKKSELELLASAEYEASRIWEDWSVARMKEALVGMWLLSFCALSCFVGLFVSFQRKKKIGNRPRKATSGRGFR